MEPFRRGVYKPPLSLCAPPCLGENRLVEISGRVCVNLLVTLFFSFSPSHLLSSPFFSLSLLVVTQIRGHIAGSFFSSPPHYGSCLAILSREDVIHLVLPSWTRVELQCNNAITSAIPPWHFVRAGASRSEARQVALRETGQSRSSEKKQPRSSRRKTRRA